MVSLHEGPDHAAVMERSVVLDAEGIPHDVEQAPDGSWSIQVADDDASAERAVLAAWEVENARLPDAGSPPERGGVLAGVAAGAATLLFALPFGLGSSGPFFQRGSADAARMLDGEWWRAVTALTLHADPEHVAGNAVALAIFVGAVSRRIGPGLAIWLAFAAGVAGNVLTALALRGGHVSVGASTAVFGALGTLSVLQIPRRSAWITLGAGVALLGLLGTGARADLLAHLAGFACGVAGGLATRRVAPARRPFLQAAVALLVLVPVTMAWSRALAR